MLFQGLSQRAVSQLDKHSEELAFQRVNDPVISTLESIFCFTKRNISDLYKPWTSTSSNHSTLTRAPRFIVISRHGVVFILITSRLAFITIDRYQSKEKYIYFCGFLKDSEEYQVSDSEMEAKDAKWKSSLGSAFYECL